MSWRCYLSQKELKEYWKICTGSESDDDDFSDADRIADLQFFPDQSDNSKMKVSNENDIVEKEPVAIEIFEGPFHFQFRM